MIRTLIFSIVVVLAVGSYGCLQSDGREPCQVRDTTLDPSSLSVFVKDGDLWIKDGRYSVQATLLAERDSFILYGTKCEPLAKRYRITNIRWSPNHRLIAFIYHSNYNPLDINQRDLDELLGYEDNYGLTDGNLIVFDPITFRYYWIAGGADHTDVSDKFLDLSRAHHVTGFKWLSNEIIGYSLETCNDEGGRRKYARRFNLKKDEKFEDNISFRIGKCLEFAKQKYRLKQPRVLYVRNHYMDLLTYLHLGSKYFDRREETVPYNIQKAIHNSGISVLIGDTYDNPIGRRMVRYNSDGTIMGDCADFYNQNGTRYLARTFEVDDNGLIWSNSTDYETLAANGKTHILFDDGAEGCMHEEPFANSSIFCGWSPSSRVLLFQTFYYEINASRGDVLYEFSDDVGQMYGRDYDKERYYKYRVNSSIRYFDWRGGVMNSFFSGDFPQRASYAHDDHGYGGKSLTGIFWDQGQEDIVGFTCDGKVGKYNLNQAKKFRYGVQLQDKLPEIEEKLIAEFLKQCKKKHPGVALPERNDLSTEVVHRHEGYPYEYRITAHLIKKEEIYFLGVFFNKDCQIIEVNTEGWG